MCQHNYEYVLWGRRETGCKHIQSGLAKGCPLLQCLSPHEDHPNNAAV